jgi:hypothetical protein
LQLSVVQAFESSQASGVPGAQTPLWQVSLPLQTEASAQGVPLVTPVFRQPNTGSHVSVVQVFESLHTGGVPEVHTASTQVSGPLQKFPSEQALPLVTGTF